MLLNYVLLNFILFYSEVKADGQRVSPEPGKTFNLAIAMETTYLSKSNNNPKGIAEYIIKSLHTENLIKAQNISIALFDSSNATLAIEFGDYDDTNDLYEAIKDLNGTSNSTTLDLGPLFALKFNKVPNVVVVIYHKSKRTTVITRAPQGNLNGVPKVAIQTGIGLGIDYSWKQIDDCFFDTPFWRNEILEDEKKKIIKSISAIGAKKDPNSPNQADPLPHCGGVSTSSDIVATIVSSFSTTLTTISATPSMYFSLSKTHLNTATTSLYNSTTYMSHTTIAATATSMTNVAASSIVEPVSENSVKEQLRKEYHRVLDYKSTEIDHTNSSLIKDFIDSAAKLLQRSNQLEDALQTETNTSSLDVLTALESYCLKVVENMVNNSSPDTLRVDNENIDVSITSIPLATFDGFDYGFLDVHAGSLHVPKDVFMDNKKQGFGGIVAMIIHPFGAFQKGQQLEKQANVTLVSNIITVTLSPHPSRKLIHPVVIKVKKNQTLETDSQSHSSCVFWEPTKFGWSTEGCHVAYSNESITECHCNHMTHYAVLMSISDKPTPEKHRKVMTIISYIGCSMSIICVFLTIVVFICLPVLRSERTRIHCNLSMAVGISQILFLAAGSDALVANEIACKIYAAIMFYSFMSVFTWMLVEGIHLYQMIIIAFINHAMMKFYYAIGWGLPLCIVVIASSISYKGYGTSDFCWLSLTDDTIWAFTGPAMLIVLINLVVLVAVLRLRSSLEKTSNVSCQVKTGARVSIVLLPLLGLTWIFGVFTALDDSVAFQYMFAITNSLQGVLIFAFHCVGNSEVRREFQRKASHWNLMRTLSSASSMVTPVNKIEPSINELQTYGGERDKVH